MAASCRATAGQSPRILPRAANFILTIDFCLILRSAYELLFCDTMTGRQITSATELRDVKWASWTCTLGWPAQGIWAAGMDGSDINAVARSHSGHLLASADDLGRVNLFRYPADQPGAASVGYAAHSSHVMNVRWTVGDEFLLSCGVSAWSDMLLHSSLFR